MKILFFELESWQETEIAQSLPDHELIFIKEPLTKHSIPLEQSDAAIICTFICSLVDASVINSFKSLQLIMTRSTGYDHIDLATARARGITVCYAPRYAQEAVAEYTFALIFSLLRAIPLTSNAVRDHQPLEHSAIRGIELAGKIIGIIGTGSIGSRVAKLSHALGMRVFAHDPHPNLTLSQNNCLTYCSLKDLLQHSNIISLHAPLNKSTHHMINRKTITEIKKGAYLINTARGALIQTAALIDALKTGIIAGAALDVLEQECFLFDQAPPLNGPQSVSKMTLENEFLLRHPRVIITPHNAYNTYEAMQRLTITTIETISAWCAGKPLNRVPE